MKNGSQYGRPAQKGTGAIAHGDADKLLWDKMSQSRVWGGSPTSVFAARRDAKIASVATLALLAVSAFPGNFALVYMAFAFHICFLYNCFGIERGK